MQLYFSYDRRIKIQNATLGLGLKEHIQALLFPIAEIPRHRWRKAQYLSDLSLRGHIAYGPIAIAAHADAEGIAKKGTHKDSLERGEVWDTGWITMTTYYVRF